VPGGLGNTAGGDYSFAAGLDATTRTSSATGTPGGDKGTFVWSDASDENGFTSTGANQFDVRATGGAAFNGTPPSPAVELSIFGNSQLGSTNADVYLQPNGANFGYSIVASGTQQSDTAFAIYHSNAINTFLPRLQITPAGFVGINRGGLAITTPIVVGSSNTTGNGASLSAGGTWTNASSREFKHDFQPVDAEAVLDSVAALPIQTWQYKDSDEGRHLGPMAEDFSAAFGLGADAQHIATVDEEGVALAAIQGLARRIARERERAAELERRVAELEADAEGGR
jgi:hypothetical protein